MSNAQPTSYKMVIERMKVTPTFTMYYVRMGTGHEQDVAIGGSATLEIAQAFCDNLNKEGQPEYNFYVDPHVMIDRRAQGSGRSGPNDRRAPTPVDVPVDAN